MSVVVQRTADGVVTVLLDRGHRHNALDTATVDALDEAVRGGGAPDARAGVLAPTRAGIFCSGADLRIPDDERAGVSDRLYELYATMIGLPLPIIAAVDGAAVG